MVGEERRAVGEAQAESTLGAAHRREAGRAEQLFGSGDGRPPRDMLGDEILGAADSRLGEGAGELLVELGEGALEVGSERDLGAGPGDAPALGERGLRLLEVVDPKVRDDEIEEAGGEGQRIARCPRARRR